MNANLTVTIPDSVARTALTEAEIEALIQLTEQDMQTPAQVVGWLIMQEARRRGLLRKPAPAGDECAECGG